jgi:hypothetical protein
MKPRYRGISRVSWILMIGLGAAALCYPDSWIARNIGFFLLFFAISLYAALALAAEDGHRDVQRINSRLDDLSRELDGMNRGLENWTAPLTRYQFD